tara:strand:- start:3361 stop:4971 length:1611 start_codon:yes stop_codon:yes gene_type:complete
MQKNLNPKSKPSQDEMAELKKLFQLNELDALEEKTKKLIGIYPKISILYNILGVVFQKKNKLSDAIFNFNKAISINPNFDQALNNLGNVLQNTGKFNDAIKYYQKAIKINPDYAEAYSNLGNTLSELGKFEEAVVNYQKALKINPNHPEFYTNLGGSLVELGKLEDAISNHKKAIKINSNYAEAYSNLGNALFELGKSNEAILNHQKAIKLNPQYKKAILNESMIRLAAGEFEIGWEKYEARLAENSKTPIRYQIEKMWDGNYLDGTLLVWGEQGVGDQVLYLSMINDLKKCAKNIILEIDVRLKNLLKRYFEKKNFTNITLIDKKFKDEFDRHIPIGSLGKFLRKSKISCQNNTGKYLISSASKEDKYKKKYFQNNKFKIGLSWKTLNKLQKYRNVDLKEMIPIISNSNCDFVNLQFGKFEEDLKYIQTKFGINIKTIKEVDNYSDLDGLAALINCLDLVISIQNSTAHIAGALGKKTYVMVSKLGTPKWHWMNEEKKSLWYPSLRIFEQEQIQSWDKVIKDINADLKKLISNIN